MVMIMEMSHSKTRHWMIPKRKEIQGNESKDDGMSSMKLEKSKYARTRRRKVYSLSLMHILAFPPTLTKTLQETTDKNGNEIQDKR
jgi:hypothetical protein